jgi:putative ABC transport system permease protein
VGVVSDIPNAGPADPALPEVDWSYARGWGRGEIYFNIVVRAARGDPVALQQSVSSAIRGIDPTASVARIEPMPEVMAESVATPRFYLALIGTFALVAVVLAIAGLYGVMSYVVAQRTREFGIRAALGSSPARTLRMVTGGGMRLVAFGALIGAACGSLATRLLANLLYGVSPADAPTWLAATLALAGAGFVASLIPALRAMMADPIVAIRTDQ